MFKNILSLPKENCFLARGTVPLESSEIPPVVTIEQRTLFEDFQWLSIDSKLHSEIYGKASSAAKNFLESISLPRYNGKGEKSSDVPCSTDFSFLWPQTAPIPPTGMISSAFSLPPLLFLKEFEAENTQFIQFIYEYYIPEKNDFLHFSSLMMWKTYITAFSAVYFSHQKNSFQSTLAYYLSPRGTGKTESGECDSRNSNASFFRAGLWNEEILFKLFSSLLSAVALFHSHGYHFCGKIEVNSILCFAVPVHVSEELHHVMSSIVSTVIADEGDEIQQEGTEKYKNQFDRILALYAKATETSIILPSSRILESTLAHQVHFVLTSVPVSGKKAAAPYIEQQYQNQDIQAIRHVMELVLLEQDSSLASSLPRSAINEELKILLRCLEFSPCETSGTLPNSPTPSPSAVQLLQLQALRLRQAAWLWQSAAELSHCHRWVLRLQMNAMISDAESAHEKGASVSSFAVVNKDDNSLTCELPLPTPCGTPSIQKNLEQKSPPKKNPLHSTNDLFHTPKRAEVRQEVSPTHPLSFTPIDANIKNQVCKKCKELENREILLSEREEKVASLLELYELTQEQLDRLPNANHFGYEELRRRLTAHLLHPVPVEQERSIQPINVAGAGASSSISGVVPFTYPPGAPVLAVGANNFASPLLFYRQQGDQLLPVPNTNEGIEVLKPVGNSLPTATVVPFPHTTHTVRRDPNDVTATDRVIHPSPPLATGSLSTNPPSVVTLHHTSPAPFHSLFTPTVSSASLSAGATVEESAKEERTKVIPVSPPPSRVSLLPRASERMENHNATPTRKVSPPRTSFVSHRDEHHSATPLSSGFFSTTTPTTTPTAKATLTHAKKTSPKPSPNAYHSLRSSLSMKSVLRHQPTTSNVPLAAPQVSLGQEHPRRKRSTNDDIDPALLKDESSSGNWMEERFSTLAALRESFEQSRPRHRHGSPSPASEHRTPPSVFQSFRESKAESKGSVESEESREKKRTEIVKREGEHGTPSTPGRIGGTVERERNAVTNHPHTTPSSSRSPRRLHRTLSAGTQDSKRTDIRSFSSSSRATGSVLQMEVEELTQETGKHPNVWTSSSRGLEDEKKATEEDWMVQDVWMCDEEDKEEEEEGGMITPKRISSQAIPSGTFSFHPCSPPTAIASSSISLSEGPRQPPNDHLWNRSKDHPLSSPSDPNRIGEAGISDYAAQELLRKLRSC